MIFKFIIDTRIIGKLNIIHKYTNVTFDYIFITIN